MNIVLSSDNNFIEHCCVTIMSIIKNNSPRINFYLLTDDLNEINSTILSDIITSNGSFFTVIHVVTQDLDFLPMPKQNCVNHISLATYYRLLISHLIPEIDKVLYLDCDVIVNACLDELWNLDISDKSIGAVYQITKWNLVDCNRLSIPPEYGYFNAGVLLINLDYWRKNNMYEIFIDYIKLNSERILYHDQDVLNATNFGNVKMLPCAYNMMTNMFYRSTRRIKNVDNNGKVITKNDDNIRELKKSLKNPVIIHFVAKPKPWEYMCKHPYRKLYEYYLKMTPFSRNIRYNENILRKIKAFFKYRRFL